MTFIWTNKNRNTRKLYLPIALSHPFQGFRIYRRIKNRRQNNTRKWISPSSAIALLIAAHWMAINAFNWNTQKKRRRRRRQQRWRRQRRHNDTWDDIWSCSKMFIAWCLQTTSKLIMRSPAALCMGLSTRHHFHKTFISLPFFFHPLSFSISQFPTFAALVSSQDRTWDRLQETALNTIFY